MTKEELRKIYLQKRLSLSEAEYTELSFQLYQTFFKSIDLTSIKILHTFLPLKKNKEPDTWLIIDHIQREFPHIRISIPRVDDHTSKLENIFFEGVHQLQKNKWGIPEPAQGLPTDPETIDMVLIPMLIFDKHGNRIGYGKGFYDKFLPTCRIDCKRVGISLFDPVERIEDINELDVPVHYCVTPSTLYRY